MNKLDRLMNKATIGYWSALGGIEVKDILYGINDYIECISNAWSGTKTAHRVVVYTTMNGRNYIKLYGNRYYLDECIKC